MFIFDYLKDKGEIADLRIIHGSIVSFTVNINGKTISFRDSYNILPASLKKLTKDFNVKHQKLEMDYELGIKDSNFKQYFENDLMGLWEVLNEAKELHNKLTIASNSMDNFLNKFYRGRAEGNYYKFDDIFRNGYHGGRTEIFRLMGTDLNYYDVNSLYPHVMHKYEYPLLQKNNFRYTSSYIPDELGVYKCVVRVPEGEYIPLLPHKTKKGKLLFPSGRFEGFYYTPEINKALSLGYDIDFIYGYTFKDTDFIFRDFVDTYYKIKQESRGARREIAKLYLNSLYGKFGQRREQDVYEIVKNKSETKKGVHTDYIFGNFSIHKKKQRLNYIPYIHTEIASLITCYARLTLYDLFERAGRENVYYCDTDSIITSSTMETSDALGAIKQEAKIDKFIALSPKVYAFTSGDKETIHVKGLKSAGLKYADFEHAIETEDLSKFVSQFERLATFREKSIRSLDSFSSKINVKKMLKSLYDKRVITSDFNTKPIKLYV